MHYEGELHFLCDVFQKFHLRTTVVHPADSLGSIVPEGISSLFSSLYPESTPIHKRFGTPEPQTLYRVTDALHFSYMYFLLPQTQKDTILFVGPYLRAPLTATQIMEIAENNGISPKNQRYLNDYYDSIPVLAESDHLFGMLDTFCERVWQSPSFAIVDTEAESQQPASPINKGGGTELPDDALVNMVAMEERYRFENELMQAVSLGQMHKASRLLEKLSEKSFERRIADPLRNAKNYSIITNTLLRKAAEKGGVHPMYLDRVSSAFALKIEQLTSTDECSALMYEMFRSYCRLVRQHSLKEYSPVVQKAIVMIESDLSANLTLSTLAADQNISGGYLATVFKKETGKTVSEYIRDKRVKHAMHLLSTTHLQVQTVALHCGIMDVQYFAKIFKKETGKTPKEYRKAAK